MYKENFENNYFALFRGTNQFRDSFREAIDIWPTESDERNSSFKPECGLNGIAGEFMRLLLDYQFDPIHNVSDLFVKIRDYINRDNQVCQFDKGSKETLERVAHEILFAGNKMSILNPSFFVYLPFTATNLDKRKRDNYKDSQIKLANYLYDMLDTDFTWTPTFENKNILVRLLQEAISESSIPRANSFQRHYTILPFVKQQFQDDLRWFLEEHTDIAITQYLPLLLYFYICYSLIQLVLNLNPNDLPDDSNKARPIYYMLDSETASDYKPAVREGWDHVAKTALPKMLAKLQTIDILNCILEEDVTTEHPIGFYPDIINELNKTPWDENVKADCEYILNKYQTEKKAVLSRRGDKNNRKLSEQQDLVFDVNSYEEFISALYDVCCRYNTDDYVTRFANKITDILKTKLLSVRRGYKVLALDEDTLLFLIALATREEPTRLKEMYKKLSDYGIIFSQESTTCIENFLLKYNLLDRKSDSGEAQYVTVVL